MSYFVKVITAGLEEACEGKDLVIAAQQKSLRDEQEQVGSLIEECAMNKGNLEGKDEEIQSLQAQIRTQKKKKKLFNCTFCMRSFCVTGGENGHYY